MKNSSELEQLEFIYNYEKNISLPLKFALMIICYLLTFYLNRQAVYQPTFYYGYIITAFFSLFFVYLYWEKNLNIVKNISFLSYAHDIAFITFLLLFTGIDKSIFHFAYAVFFIRAAVNYASVKDILISGLGIFTPIYFLGIYFFAGFAPFLTQHFWMQYIFLWAIIISSFGVVSLLNQQKIKIENNLKEIKNLQTQLIQAEKMSGIGVLAGGVAHELNNPLGSILGFSQLLLKDLNNNNPQNINVTKDLEKIEKSALRCKRIVESLLNFSRQSKSQFLMFEVKKALEETISLCQYQINNKKINLQLNLPEKSPTLFGDPSQIQQVFMNLILNALDAVKEKGNITITLDLKKIEEIKQYNLNFNENSDLVFISIKDDGCGINQENINKIFEPFFTTKEVGQGTGLGLSIAYGIIKKHYGEIIVESKENSGSNFIVIIPTKVDKIKERINEKNISS